LSGSISTKNLGRYRTVAVTRDLFLVEFNRDNRVWILEKCLMPHG
jgi:hypothetical protein